MKPYLSWDEQVDLLISRGLIVEDRNECVSFLKSRNYYRLSGYARYFQQAPHADNNQFMPKVSFDTIRKIYDADTSIRTKLGRQLARAEILLRSHTANVIARDYSPYSDYLEQSFYREAENHVSTAEYCQHDLQRSKERYIRHFINEVNGQESFEALPIWAAVEALSFGTLSKCIERGGQGNLGEQVASSIGVAKAGFPYRVRSLVYLRNRCAHHSRLWNHSVIDAGPTPNNIRKKAKRIAGQFEPRSVVDVVASLDDIVVKGKVGEPILPELIECYKSETAVWNGYVDPKKPQDHV